MASVTGKAAAMVARPRRRATFTVSRQALDSLLHIEETLSQRVCADCHSPVEEIDLDDVLHPLESDALCPSCMKVGPSITMIEAILKVVTDHE